MGHVDQHLVMGKHMMWFVACTSNVAPSRLANHVVFDRLKAKITFELMNDHPYSFIGTS